MTTETQNPHDSEAALEHSSYNRFVEGVLVDAVTGEPAATLADRVHSALRAFVLDPEFPCVGSRSALNQGSYRFAMYKEMNTPEATEALAHDLQSFSKEVAEIEGEFTTFVVSFDSPKSISPEEFEDRLWKQLAALHEMDAEAWDPAVSSDVHDPKFGFSFAGMSFFVVGLSPMAERWARRFPWPTLAFNPHAHGCGRWARKRARRRELQAKGWCDGSWRAHRLPFDRGWREWICVGRRRRICATVL